MAGTSNRHVCAEAENGDNRWQNPYELELQPIKPIKVDLLAMPLDVENVRRLVMVADRLLEGKTREEASKDYPTEDDYWKAVVDGYIRSCHGNR